MNPSGVTEQPPDRDQMPSSPALDGARQSCFVIATSMPPAASPDPLRAASRARILASWPLHVTFGYVFDT
jgi:hypothetical protein